MGDPCAACKHAYDNQACDKCIDFGDWSPCRQLAPIVERIRVEERERCAKICDYRASCPLPRIGSKEWGWDLWCSTDREDFYAAKDHEANYAVRQDETNTFPYAVVNKANRTSVAIFRGRDEAFRFAELLARRDWRRENRGKNG